MDRCKKNVIEKKIRLNICVFLRKRERKREGKRERERDAAFEVAV